LESACKREIMISLTYLKKVQPSSYRQRERNTERQRDREKQKRELESRKQTRKLETE
jgi:hypothetical protein